MGLYTERQKILIKIFKKLERLMFEENLSLTIDTYNSELIFFPEGKIEYKGKTGYIIENDISTGEITYPAIDEKDLEKDNIKDIDRKDIEKTFLSKIGFDVELQFLEVTNK